MVIGIACLTNILIIAIIIAVFRIQAADSSLEGAVEESENTLSSDVVAQLSASLELTVCELTACRDCCDVAQNQLAKLTGMPAEELNDKSRMHTQNMMNNYSCIIMHRLK